MTADDHRAAIRELAQVERRYQSLSPYAPIRAQLADAIQTASELYAEHLAASYTTTAPEAA